MKKYASVSFLGALALIMGTVVLLSSQEASMPDLARLQAMTARFAPVEISADISRLFVGERRALAKMVQAGQLMDVLFLRQVWAGMTTCCSTCKKTIPP